MVAPVIIFAGLAALGAAIGIAADVASGKSESEKKDIQNKADELRNKANALVTSGALYPAYRANVKYVEYIKKHYDLTPEHKQQLDDSVADTLRAAKAQYKSLKLEYQAKAEDAEGDDSGGELFKVQSEYMAKLEKLLGTGAPHLKVVENSFGINYQVHKHGLPNN